MGNHTSAPWIQHVLATREDGVEIIGNYGELIATVHDIGYAHQEEANAALFAAAPNLLAACEKAAGWLESFGIPKTTTAKERDEILDTLRAAIAMATP